MKKYLTMVALVLLSGCGTILNGSKQEIKINIPEANADTKIFLNGTDVSQFNKDIVNYQNSIIIDKKNENNFITIKSPKHHDVNIYLTREMDSVAVAFDVIFGVLPIFVDMYTKGLYVIEPSEFHVVLREKEKDKK